MAFVSVVAFVDWKSQLHNANTIDLGDPVNKARLTIKHVARVVANAIDRLDDNAGNKYRVTFRLYHGWHRGLSPTEARLAMMQIENNPDFTLPKTRQNVLFEPQFQYGERLIDSLPHRLVRQSRRGLPSIHLPDTFRPPIEAGAKWREKMVDTALACDILSHARHDARDWRIVLAEDDDLVPALYVAEAWSKSKGGRTVLVRKRGESRHLLLDGLLKDYAL